MKFSQFSSRRRVFVKRVASVCSISAAALLAGCGSQGISFWDGGSESESYRAGSIPIPSEPIPGRRGNAAHAPAPVFQPAVATSQSSGPAIQRTALAPVHPVSGDQGAAGYIGGSFAMQPIEPAPAKATSPLQGKRYAQAPGDYSDDAEPIYSSDDRDYEGPRKRYPRGYVERPGAYEDDAYVVTEGDTLYGIAKRFGLSTVELAELNGITSSTIYVGQRLKLRGPKYTAAHRYDEAPRKKRHAGGYDNGYASEERKAPPYEPDRDDRAEDEPASHDGRPYKHKPSYAVRPSYEERPSYAEQPSYQAYREARGHEERRDERYEPRDEAPEERYEKRHGERRDARPDYGRYEDEPQTYRKPKGSYFSYSVQPGETLDEIAERHGLSRRELAEYNDIPPSARLYPGQVLRLPKVRDYGLNGRPERYEGRPEGRRVPYSQKAPAAERDGKPERRLAKTEPARSEPAPADTARVEPVKQESRPETRQAEPAAAPRSEPAPAPAPATENATPAPMPAIERDGRPILAAHSDVDPAKADAKTGVADGKDCEALLNNPVPRSAQTFREPVQGLIVAKFGSRNDGSFSDGIDFAVPKGTPVKAAENGVVAYVGNELSGFGNLVLVRHADGYVTAYAHNDEVLVSRCETVKRGQIISKAGATGSVSQPQLHFELRKDSKAVDPEAFFSRS
jgi:murein DD-endopeptidase MepM/ murein hydrolase activator NlpD